MRNCIINILSEYYHMDEKLYLRILGIIDDLSLMFNDKNLDQLVDK